MPFHHTIFTEGNSSGTEITWVFDDMNGKGAITSAAGSFNCIVVPSSAVVCFAIECDIIAQTEFKDFRLVIGGVSSQDKHMR